MLHGVPLGIPCLRTVREVATLMVLVGVWDLGLGRDGVRCRVCMGVLW